MEENAFFLFFDEELYPKTCELTFKHYFCTSYIIYKIEKHEKLS